MTNHITSCSPCPSLTPSSHGTQNAVSARLAVTELLTRKGLSPP